MYSIYVQNRLNCTIIKNASFCESNEHYRMVIDTILITTKWIIWKHRDIAGRSTLPRLFEYRELITANFWVHVTANVFFDR